MNNVLKSVLEEELERNQRKQEVFSNELLKYHKGSLSIIKIKGKKYLYRKYRLNSKIVTEYIGSVASAEADKAIKEKEKYNNLKKDLKDLKVEEEKLKRVLKIYD